MSDKYEMAEARFKAREAQAIRANKLEGIMLLLNSFKNDPDDNGELLADFLFALQEKVDDR